MNENIDLCKILKDCPKGWQLHSPIHGRVLFERLDTRSSLIFVRARNFLLSAFQRDGRITEHPDAECCLFPSKEQRDWSKFIAPWYKNEKFDPKMLKSFDKILARDNDREIWNCDLFSFMSNDRDYPYVTFSTRYKQCIPYNDDTNHLVGTTDEAPEFYRYWTEDWV